MELQADCCSWSFLHGVHNPRGYCRTVTEQHRKVRARAKAALQQFQAMPSRQSLTHHLRRAVVTEGGKLGKVAAGLRGQSCFKAQRSCKAVLFLATTGDKRTQVWKAEASKHQQLAASSQRTQWVANAAVIFQGKTYAE